MNQEIKKRWVEELRSGKHAQGRGRLCDHEGRVCALGVLCEMAIEEGLPIRRTYSGAYEELATGYWMVAQPPVVVFDWAGLTKSQAEEVVGANDTGHSFIEVARLIEGSPW